MNLHTTQDTFDYIEAGNRFVYKPVISGVDALAAAGYPKVDAGIIASSLARLIPYPEPYSGPHQFPAVTGITTDLNAGILTFYVEDALPGLIASGKTYRCYYNLTYYGFSDPSSRSSEWYIRRGLIDDMYTPASVYGGGVPLSPCYYVSNTGNDYNMGLTKETAFLTLAKAIKAVRVKTIPWIKTVAVLGTLDDTSESTQPDSGYKQIESVFAVPNPQAGEYADFIRITGDPAFTGGGAPAVLCGMTGKRVLYINGANTKIRLDNIQITRGSTGNRGGGILIDHQAEVIIEDGADIHHNSSGIFGGGVGIINSAAFTMKGGLIRDNSGRYGGGVEAVDTGLFTMSGGTIQNNTGAEAGGGVNIEYSNSRFVMNGGYIINNTNPTGTNDHPCGGVRIGNSAHFTMTAGEISGNTSRSDMYGPAHNLRCIMSSSITIGANPTAFYNDYTENNAIILP